ncbi:MAG: membrane or secreted protein [Flavobacteriaceae bacterium]
MKKVLTLLAIALVSFSLKAQSPIGAWEMYSTNEIGDKLKSVVIFADGFQVISVYNADTGKFVSTNGGTWKLEGDKMTEKVEFDTASPERVGSEVTFNVEISENTIKVIDSTMKLTRIDSGTPGNLQGAWLMSGRVRDGNEQLRDTSGPRKTMKLLSGTRFQWIAYNTETKQFMGTGGGTYTTENEEYTENIEFFSRDDSKVGISLKFDYNLVDGNWHHKGFSSKGDAMHEIWSVRNQ